MVFSEFKIQRHTEGRSLGPSAVLLCPAGLHFSAGLQRLLPGCANQPLSLRGVLSPCPLRGPPVLPSSAQRWPRSCSNPVAVPPNTSDFQRLHQHQHSFSKGADGGTGARTEGLRAAADQGPQDSPELREAP